MLQTAQAFLDRWGQELDRLTGTEGSLGYVLIVALVVAGYIFTGQLMTSEQHWQSSAAKKQEEEEEEPDPPRNFTLKQLRDFDGSVEDEKRPDILKPVYLSVKGTVFDVSQGRDFYGKGGPYEVFAGRECGIALAKMAFDDQYLDSLDGLEDLNFGERTELDGWIDKFRHYRNYPVMGKVIFDDKLPKSDRIVTKKELSESVGTGETPEGYATPPILVAASGKVYDMSFGGVIFYGPGGPYHKFAGHDVTRALALMSLDEADINNPDVSDINEKQRKTLNDWIKTFAERKAYPVVGVLEE